MGKVIRCSQSEVVLHLNASKYRKIGKTRPRMFPRIVGDYEP